jgi:cell division septal protein FtsQ
MAVVKKAKSGIIGYVHTRTSITIKFSNGDAYRYDVSEVLDKSKLKQMVALAKKGSGLNAYLNKNPQIKKYGYIDTTLPKGSYKPYAA